MTTVLKFPDVDPDALRALSVDPQPESAAAGKGKLGRPTRAAIEKHKKPGVVGRPPGTAARVREFHARLLATKGDTIIETIMRKALDDQDKDQIAALKMCVDRLLPLSYFEKGSGGQRPMVNIQIMSTDQAVPVVIDAQDAEYTEDE